jgi:copper chaperone NosL
VFLIGAVAGLVDFWLWSYDYGHNLDPTAAIKVPGMSYQPPLIGSKQLLNFVATSWPALGGLAAMVSVGIGSLVSIGEWRRARRSTENTG